MANHAKPRGLFHCVPAMNAIPPHHAAVAASHFLGPRQVHDPRPSRAVTIHPARHHTRGELAPKAAQGYKIKHHR